MKVSVIITTKNRYSSLTEALKSVIFQTIPPAEIIIINDGNPLDLNISNYQYSGNIIIHENKFSCGANFSRNLGANIALRDILMFLDDDDTWEPTKIEDQLNVFKNDCKVGFVYTGKLFVNARDRSKILYKAPPSKKGDLKKEILLKNIPGSTSAVAIKKEIFFKAGGFDEELNALQDYDLWIRCAQITHFSHDNNFNLRYTINDSGFQTTKNIKARIEAIKRLKDKYNNYFNSLNWFLKRKRFSAFYFSISKTMKMNNKANYIFWLMKALVLYPRLRYLAVILPDRINYKLKGLITNEY
jgi:glycosyltransferase involved in cell wall biosynthesis